MADPITIALISAAGTLVSGFAAMQQSQYQAAVAEANAQQARYNAKLKLEEGAIAAEDTGARNRGEYGSGVSRQAASGLALNSPSLQRTRVNVGRLGFEEQVRIMRRANQEWANDMTQANIFEAEAKNAKQQGQLAMIGSVIGAGGSLVGGAQTTMNSPSFIPTPIPRPKYFNNPNRLGSVQFAY